MSLTRPMLAAAIKDVNDIDFSKGVLVSPKLDGIRCIKVNGKALSRSFKPIPNHFIRNWVEANLPDGIDGELMLAHTATFQEITSAVMSHSGEPDFSFCAFDLVREDLAEPFVSRYKRLMAYVESREMDSGILELVPHTTLFTVEELDLYERTNLALGFEGVMVRDPQGQYKCGRSTAKQGWLLKLKRFEDSEAVILGFEEQMTNTNEKEVNELGLSKRSSKQEGKVGANTLGKFQVKDLHSGVEFEIGTGIGLTQELRKEIWENHDQYRGQLVKYKFQNFGVKEKPRSPIFLGFRSSDDL